jgi:predicted dehydrogenase
MLSAERLDGVIVSTPHVAHAGPTIAALQAGAHVLVEKPMATTGADARAIASAARAAGRQVMVPCGMNFTDFTATAAGFVRDGRIGEVRHAICQMGSALDDLFAGEPMMETRDHLFRPPADTWADPSRAGGYGWGQLSHALTWLMHVSGLSLETVCAMTGASPTGVDYYDAAIGRAAGGATVTLSGASTVPKHVGMHMDIRIYGTQGLVFFANAPARLELRRLDGADEIVAVTDAEGEYDGALPARAFAAFCAGKPVENPADAECGVRVVEALEALYRSAQSGRPEPTGAV